MLAIGLLIGAAGCSDPVEQIIAQAAAMREAGDLRAAINKLNTALARQPKNIPARLLAVQIYLDLERGDAALGLLMRAREDGVEQRQILALWTQAEFIVQRFQEVLDDTAELPEDLPVAARASLLAYRGAALAALGRSAEAERAFEDALVTDPRSLDVQILMARRAIERNSIDQARQHLATATGMAPNDRRVKQLAADVAYAAGDYEAAEQVYRAILDTEPWNELVRGQLAAVQIAQNKLAEAIATIDAALLDAKSRRTPKHPLLHYTRALAAFRQQDYATAQANAAAVVARMPAFERARLMAGAASYALQAYEQAYYYLSPYVSNNPWDAAARKLLAATQLRLGRAADATDTLGPLRSMSGEDVELLQLISEAAVHGSDLESARRYMSLALKRQPDDPLLATQLGILEIAAGEAEAAINNLERVATRYPTASLPEVPLFVAFMQVKDYERALAAAERLKKAAPSEPIGEILTATVHFNQGKMQAGREALLRAREIRRGDITANDALARLALAAGRPEEARRYLQDVLDANPQSAATYIALAALEVKTGRAAAAEAILRKGTQTQAADRELVIALARLQLAQGEAENALATATEGLKKFPKEPNLLDIAGNAQFALGRSDEALSIFKDLTDVAPDLAAGHIGLARYYLAQVTPDNPQWAAVNEAVLAVNAAPRDTTAKLLLARALALHGRFVEASELVTELKPVMPRDAELLEIEAIVMRGQGRAAEAAVTAAGAAMLKEGAARRRIAEQQLRQGETNQAAQHLADWLATHPDDSETRTILAEIYVNTGRLDEARAHYLHLAAHEPKNPIIQNNLAWVMARLGRWQEALTHARAAVTLQPGSVEFLDTLGSIQLQTGKLAEALETLQTAWSRAADRPDIGYHLSQALAAANRKEEALSVLRRILNDTDTAFAERDKAQLLLQQLGG
jgi:putative PEP-CTERM system TPR-repeat lipoprotein